MNAARHDDMTDDDAKIDRYHDGYGAFLARKPVPADPDAARGWHDAESASRVRVVMPERPEGYYHSPLGTHD